MIAVSMKPSDVLHMEDGRVEIQYITEAEMRALAERTVAAGGWEYAMTVNRLMEIIKRKGWGCGVTSLDDPTITGATVVLEFIDNQWAISRATHNCGGEQIRSPLIG